MYISELSRKLPAAPDAIGDVLAQAAIDRLVEVEHIGEDPKFKPRPRHED